MILRRDRVNKVEVYMLGRFSIMCGDEDILDVLGNSKKKIQLLQYLLVNKDTKYTNYNLFEHLWPSDDTSNPESALKTLVSRLRQDLRAFGLSSLISTRKGVYQLNEELCENIDLYEFEQLAADATGFDSLDEKTSEIFERILFLYQGDLLPGYDTEAWVVHKSMYYHTLFLKAAYRYISLLSDENRYQDIIRVSRKALEVDEFDSKLNLEYMTALLALEMKTEALNHYNYTVDLCYTQLGTKPSDDILDFYKNLIRMEHNSNASLNTISDELESDINDNLAFVCDYSIFRDIYRINMRNLQRLDISILLAVITMSGSTEGRDDDHISQNKVMEYLQDLMQRNLRKGDTISRYGPSQFAVLLPSANMKTGTLVMERVKGVFYRESKIPGFVFSYKIKPLAYRSDTDELPEHIRHK